MDAEDAPPPAAPGRVPPGRDGPPGFRLRDGIPVVLEKEIDTVLRFLVVLAALLLVACASPPQASTARFGLGVANEAAALAAARTPDEKVLVLLDILDHRVDQMESAAMEDAPNVVASVANAYRRISLEALLKILSRSERGAVSDARNRMGAHAGRLARIVGGRDALLACRFVLQAIAVP